MKRELIKNILKGNQCGSEIKVAGWVRTRRDSKGGFSFIELNDGSCFANLQVIAGTDPNDSTSVFRVATVSNAADGFIVTWQSVADKTYTIEFSTTMNGDWINVGTQASAGAETSFTDTDAGRLAASVGYYRVTVN